MSTPSQPKKLLPKAQTKTDDLARALAGKTVIIGGVGGTICVNPSDRRTVTTNFRRGTPLKVELIEYDEEQFGLLPPSKPAAAAAGDDQNDEPNETTTLVTFRVLGSNKYLSVTLYGDEVRNATAEALSHSPLLPALIPAICDFLVEKASAEGNFEGAGYNYSPVTAEDGPPGLLQVYRLERQIGGRYGIQSLFRTYWRSQHWEKVVGQAPHCLGDERWRITVQETS